MKSGQDIHLSFLRPAKLVEALGPGDTIQLSVLQLDVRGQARVIAVKPCPQIEEGAGHIVTGTLRSQSVDVRLLKLVGLDTPIEVTGNHPVFSEDRHDFVLVDRLGIGERLRTREGTAIVESVAKKLGTWDVFNLEVQRAHQYYVTEKEVLVHNDNGSLTEGNDAGNAEQGDASTDNAQTTPTDLYAFGNKSAPRGARAVEDFGVTDGSSVIGPDAPPTPPGASSFGDPTQSNLTGQYHVLPAGSPLPPELGVVPDGVDVIPTSDLPATHNTFYAKVQMTVDQFNQLFKSLGWKYAGKQ